MINIEKTTRIILALFSIELLSLISFFNFELQYIFFFFILSGFFLLSLYSLEAALHIIFIEIIIGSFGYLFWFEWGGTKISIRIAIWLIFMAVWLSRLLIDSIKERKLILPFSAIKLTKTLNPKNNPINKSYFLLIFFITAGFFVGLISGNSFDNVFFDVNAWAFFLLYLPYLDLAQGSDDFYKKLKIVFYAGTIWLSIKTFLLLYFFSHGFPWQLEIYQWVRDTRAGEITSLEGGYHRVFSQSHIYVLIGLFVALSDYYLYIVKGKLFFFSLSKSIRLKFSGQGNKLSLEKNKIFLFFIIAFFLSVNLVNFSRSNWLGLVFGLIVYRIALFFVFKISWKKLLNNFSVFIFAFIFAIVLITIAVYFPIPKSSASISTSKILHKRTQNLYTEAGASSRWNLLPVLLMKIKEAPFLGKGFGTTVTYVSNDPRVRAENSDGEHTTFAFEWGWLDMWLKIGILGSLSYLLLIFFILKSAAEELIRQPDSFYFGLAIGLMAILAVNMFSPYLNHPLGIVLVVVMAVLPKAKK